MKKHFTNFSRIQAAEAPEFIRGEEPPSVIILPEQRHSACRANGFAL